MDGYDSRSRFILIIRLIDNAKVVGRESINLFDNRYFDVSCTFRSSSCCCIINRRIKYKVTFEVTAFGGKHSEKKITEGIIENGAHFYGSINSLLIFSPLCLLQKA